MNKIGLNKRFRMGWNDYVRLMSLLMFLCLNLCAATAQDKVQLDVTRLTGADPADIINKDNTHRITPNNKQGKDTTFMLLNVGTQQFLNVGGSYSRHATLRDNGIYLWIYNNSKTPGTYNIRTRRNMKNGIPGEPEDLDNKDSYVQYIDNDPLMPGVYPDEQPEDVSRQFGWAFEKAAGYSASNKVYKIKTYGNRYLTAVPNDNDDNKCWATTQTADNADYQIWKLVTLTEYLSLYKDSPSDSANPIDITFWFDTPEFGYNTSNYGGWKTTGGHSDDIYLGIDDCYKKVTESYYKGTKKDDKQYIFDNSKYFCAVIKERHGIGLQQQVAISQPGWYVVRCNGFSKTNGLAKLYIKEFWTGYGLVNIEPVSVTIKTLEKTDGPTNMAEAGKAFYNGEYPNEAKIHITNELFDMLESMELQKSTTLTIGIKIDGKDTDNATGEWTAFDNFQLLYYGEEAEKPALVLDEENPDLNYLTETSDSYENVTLHLNRSFTLNKWNTLTLPVSLTYGQMKSAFGDDVLLAELDGLTATSVRFQTVNCTNDNDVMLKAFTPYIIKPTKGAAATEAYTTPRLKKSPNQYWLADGVGETNTEDGETRHESGKVEVKAGHYTIDGVTLDREDLKTNLDNHWVSTTTITTPTTAASASKMVCKGTMAKTFYVDSSKKGWFYTDNGEKRDNLAGDYFMKDGTMYKVPATKQYGLKAFRCWFELSDTTDKTALTTAPAKDVSLFIDDIKDGVTGIDDITTDPNSSNAKNLSGVYNIYGQRLSDGSSLDNLPQGIYIVNGKKVRK